MKYIRTYYNNEKCIIKISGCNNCPLMMFNESLFTCDCKYYKSQVNNTIKDFVSVYYNGSKPIIEYIEPPYWCKLPNNLNEMFNSKQTFTLTDIGIHVKTNDNDLNCLMINSMDLNYDINNIYKNNLSNDHMVISPQNKKEHRRYNKHTHSTNKHRTGRGTYNSKVMDEYNLNSSKIKNSKICSLCGEEDETVDRNKNFGMCDCCSETSNNDENKLNQAFINNFRIKRNIKIEYNIEFKKLKEFKIK